MKKYKAEAGWQYKITLMDIDKETDKSVVVNGGRENKSSCGVLWCDSWEEGHAFLLKTAEGKVLGALSRLETYKGHLGNVKGMKPPKAEGGPV